MTDAPLTPISNPPSSGDDDDFQDSLQQLEQLAAELQELADVIAELDEQNPAMDAAPNPPAEPTPEPTPEPLRDPQRVRAIGWSVVPTLLPQEHRRDGDLNLVFGADVLRAAVPRVAVPLVSSTGIVPNARPIPIRRHTEDDPHHRSADWSTRRRVLALVVVSAFTVPVFAAAAMQPWRSANAEVLTLAATERGAGTVRGALPPYVVGPESVRGPAARPARPQLRTRSAPAARPPAAVAPAPSLVPSPPAVHPYSSPLGLRLRLRADDVQPEVGEPVWFVLVWRDGSGHPAGVVQHWADGTPDGGAVATEPCTGDAPASRGDGRYSHTFQTAGTFVVRFTVTTYTCDGDTDSLTVQLPVVVTAHRAELPEPELPAAQELPTAQELLTAQEVPSPDE